MIVGAVFVLAGVVVASVETLSVRAGRRADEVSHAALTEEILFSTASEALPLVKRLKQPRAPIGSLPELPTRL